jgi:hypothetical protein
LALAALQLKTQHIENVDDYVFPEIICFYNMSWLAFAGFRWLWLVCLMKMQHLEDVDACEFPVFFFVGQYVCAGFHWPWLGCILRLNTSKTLLGMSFLK